MSDKATTSKAVSADEADEEHSAADRNVKKPRKKREKRIEQNDTYQCEVCDYKTGYKGFYDRHMFRHQSAESKEVSCNYCEKIFPNVIQLSTHLNTHYGIKPFKCDHCDDSFKTKGEVDRHVKYKHTQEKPHKCSECDYSTVELSKLKRHMRVHTGERPYLCEFCDYASRDTFKLKRHLRTHTGEKPYVCPACKRAFGQSNTLKVHINTFHPQLVNSQPEQSEQQQSSDSEKVEPKPTKRKRKNSSSRVKRISLYVEQAEMPAGLSDVSKLASFIDEERSPDNDSVVNDQLDLSQECMFTCSECLIKFSTQELLVEHYVKHTGERPYECEICRMKFSHKFALKAHVMSHDSDYALKLKQAHMNAARESNPIQNRFSSTKRTTKSSDDLTCGSTTTTVKLTDELDCSIESARTSQNDEAKVVSTTSRASTVHRRSSSVQSLNCILNSIYPFVSSEQTQAENQSFNVTSSSINSLNNSTVDDCEIKLLLEELLDRLEQSAQNPIERSPTIRMDPTGRPSYPIQLDDRNDDDDVICQGEKEFKYPSPSSSPPPEIIEVQPTPLIDLTEKDQPSDQSNSTTNPAKKEIIIKDLKDLAPKSNKIRDLINFGKCISAIKEAAINQQQKQQQKQPSQPSQPPNYMSNVYLANSTNSIFSCLPNGNSPAIAMPTQPVTVINPSYPTNIIQQAVPLGGMSTILGGGGLISSINPINTGTIIPIGSSVNFPNAIQIPTPFRSTPVQLPGIVPLQGGLMPIQNVTLSNGMTLTGAVTVPSQPKTPAPVKNGLGLYKNIAPAKPVEKSNPVKSIVPTEVGKSPVNSGALPTFVTNKQTPAQAMMKLPDKLSITVSLPAPLTPVGSPRVETTVQESSSKTKENLNPNAESTLTPQQKQKEPVKEASPPDYLSNVYLATSANPIFKCLAKNKNAPVVEVDLALSPEPVVPPKPAQNQTHLKEKTEQPKEQKKPQKKETDMPMPATMEPYERRYRPNTIYTLIKNKGKTQQEKIVDSIEATLAGLNERDVPGEQLADKRNKKGVFKKGNRKKIDQVVENSFVDMDKPTEKIGAWAKKAAASSASTNKLSENINKPSPPPNTFKCTYCSRSYDSEYNMDKHLRTVHKIVRKKLSKESKKRDGLMSHLNATASSMSSRQKSIENLNLDTSTDSLLVHHTSNSSLNDLSLVDGPPDESNASMENESDLSSSIKHRSNDVRQVSSATDVTKKEPETKQTPKKLDVVTCLDQNVNLASKTPTKSLYAELILKEKLKREAELSGAKNQTNTQKKQKKASPPMVKKKESQPTEVVLEDDHDTDDDEYKQTIKRRKRAKRESTTNRDRESPKSEKENEKKEPAMKKSKTEPNKPAKQTPTAPQMSLRKRRSHLAS